MKFIINKSLKKLLVVFIIAVFAIGLLAACDEDDDTQTTTAPEAEITSVQKAEGTAILPNLPEYDWEGYALRVLSDDWTGKAIGAWQSRDIVAEEETGEPINDAVYRRNMALKEKYNFIIINVRSINPSDTLQKAVFAGDNSFDIISTPTAYSAQNAQKGLLLDLYDINYLDFEKPWWDKGAVAGASLGNRLFFLSGDCTLASRDATAVVLFNKKLREDLGLENLYELVHSGQWTISKLYEMAKIAGVDLDGNGKMDLDVDRFGFIPDGSVTDILQGMGVTFAEKNADGLPVLTYASERTFTAVNDYLALIYADFTCISRSGNTFETGDSMEEDTFEENRGLFLFTGMRSVEHLRTMDADFGILPLPKFDENQHEWRHGVDIKFGTSMAIPKFFAANNLALDRVGFMLEAMAAESSYTVIPAYYDVQLRSKVIRDEESREMLDIIFGSMVWDTGIIYDWFNFFGGTGPGMLSTVSGYESRRGMIEAVMQATVDAFANIN